MSLKYLIVPENKIMLKKPNENEKSYIIIGTLKRRKSQLKALPMPKLEKFEQPNI